METGQYALVPINGDHRTRKQKWTGQNREVASQHNWPPTTMKNNKCTPSENSPTLIFCP